MVMRAMASRMLFACLMVFVLLGCGGGTRVALPLPMAEVVEEVPKLDLFDEGDRIRYDGGSDGRIRLLVEHRDPAALWKDIEARTVLVFTRLSSQSSEVLIRSDVVGWLYNDRDSAREQFLATGMREWAEKGFLKLRILKE